jgi:site-specific DNA-methyltransferase (adenine-specific)
VTDPPFAEKTHKGARGRGASTGGKHVLVNFDALETDEFLSIAAMLVDASRRWVVMTCDWRHAAQVEQSALPVVRLGVWTKVDPAPQFTGDRPGTGWEAILFLHREGAKWWNGGGRSSVWHTKIVKNNASVSSEKPIDLVSDFVRLFSDPGELVLDPFLGSGTTGVASVREGRHFVGCEINPKHFDIACRRISDELKRPRLFSEAAPAPKQEALL